MKKISGLNSIILFLLFAGAAGAAAERNRAGRIGVIVGNLQILPEEPELIIRRAERQNRPAHIDRRQCVHAAVAQNRAARQQHTRSQ